MAVFDRYIFRNILIATVFTALVLAGIILLTQSLRFLDLIVNSGASGKAFWILTMLALPRFFEVILPIALMAAVVFIYNKMITDSELIVMRSIGAGPLRLARPALILSGGIVIFLLFVTMWLAPASLSGMHQLRVVIKAQYSTLLFREGVFNAARPGLTVFIRERTNDGSMRGVLIHDSRPENETPVTILAKRGVVVSSPEGQQVLVYEGSRQSVNANTGVLDRLDFESYTIDLPEGGGPVRQRWREPDERTFLELLRPDPTNKSDMASKRGFMVEIHRRIVSPFLAPAFAIMSLAFLLTGTASRRGYSWRVVFAIAAAVVVQGLYLGALGMARQHDAGLASMYFLVSAPIAGGLFFLSESAHGLRSRIFLKNAGKGNAPA